MAKNFLGRWIAIISIIVNVIGIPWSVPPLVPLSFFMSLLQFLCFRPLAIWSLILGVQLLIHPMPDKKMPGRFHIVKSRR